MADLDSLLEDNLRAALAPSAADAHETMPAEVAKLQKIQGVSTSTSPIK